VEPNAVPIVGSNIGNLIASLQAKNKVAQTLIFKFPDVVKLNAINVDLDYATTKSTFISIFLFVFIIDSNFSYFHS